MSKKTSVPAMLTTASGNTSFSSYPIHIQLRGVNVGGTGGHVPPEFGVGDANV